MTKDTLHSNIKHSRFSGFMNMMRKEIFGERSRRFWIFQIFAWLLFIVVIPVIVLVLPVEVYTEMFGDIGLQAWQAGIITFFALGGMMPMLFMPPLVQGVVVDE